MATYIYAKAVLDGAPEAEAKERGMVAAIMGAKAKLGHTVIHAEQKTEAGEKKKKTITADSFDRQVSRKMGALFDSTFLPAIRRFAQDGLSYNEVKRRLKIPSTWGAKITAELFKERSGLTGPAMPCRATATVMPGVCAVHAGSHIVPLMEA
jgi:hypothetical protein